MKRKLAASVIILTVAFGGLTACSNQTASAPEKSTPTATASKTPAVDTKEQNATAAASTYKEFLTDLYKVQNADVQAAVKKYSDGSTELNDETKTKLLDGLRTEFPFLNSLYIKGYTLDEQGKLYGSLLSLGAAVKKNDVTIRVPSSAVDASEKSAVLDGSQVDVVVDGQPVKSTYEQSVQLYKVDGKWQIDPASLLASK
jgi:hypothetical protein